MPLTTGNRWGVNITSNLPPVETFQAIWISGRVPVSAHFVRGYARSAGGVVGGLGRLRPGPGGAALGIDDQVIVDQSVGEQRREG